jgi:hypothetical protein
VTTRRKDLRARNPYRPPEEALDRILAADRSHGDRGFDVAVYHEARKLIPGAMTAEEPWGRLAQLVVDLRKALEIVAEPHERVNPNTPFFIRLEDFSFDLDRIAFGADPRKVLGTANRRGSRDKLRLVTALRVLLAYSAELRRADPKGWAALPARHTSERAQRAARRVFDWTPEVKIPRDPIRWARGIVRRSE